MSDEGESSTTNQRSKRRKIDKFGRAAAFERLKGLKGSKNKFMDDAPSNVYDIVDENEYSKLVSDRAECDWIVDDDGNGYVEDGREIFDDEEDFEDTKLSRNKDTNKSKRKRNTESVPSNKKGSLKNFLTKTDGKKKEAQVSSVDDDVLLNNILGEIASSPGQTPSVNKAPVVIKPAAIVKTSLRITKNDDEEVKKYLEVFGKSLKKDKIDDQKLFKQEEMETKNVNSIKPKFMQKPPTVTVAPQSPVTISTTQESIATSQTTIPVTQDMDLDFGEDIPLIKLETAEKEAFMQIEESKILKTKDIKKPDVKPLMKLSNKPVNCESNIFLELEGINFDEEIDLDSSISNLDLNTESMKFFYWDAWADQIKRPGEVFIFGKVEVPNKKVKEYKSIMVHVENVDRVLYLLPRTHVFDYKTKTLSEKEVTLTDVYNEFNDRVSVELKIPSFRSRKVVKNFAFSVPDVDVPAECEYLEVRFSGTTQISSLKKEYSTIAYIFGINTSPIETFLLERKIKGPNWLEISHFKPTKSLLSWSKVEVSVPDMKYVKICEGMSNVQPPPLVICALKVETITNGKTGNTEIVMISVLQNSNFSVDKQNKQLVSKQFCGVTRPSSKNWPFDIQQKLQQNKKFKIFKHDSERFLLQWFLSIYQAMDPDVIVTPDAHDAQLDIICNRLSFYKISMWSRIGRLKINQMTGKRIEDFLIGRMICDVKLSAEELIKSRSYDLGTLCKEVLKIGEDERQEILHDNKPFAFDSSDTILELIELNIQDCLYTLKLMNELNILPLALQITNIAGNLLSRTLRGGRSERNEMLLLHAFHEKDYIVPDKQMKDENMKAGEKYKKKAAYAGGLVLEPVKGFYNSYVLLMDFNSLYPSIIQEYNICFTTTLPPANENQISDVPDSSIEIGILPRQIRRLVESRKNVKSLMAKEKSPDLKQQYNIRQMALKLTANSMYGCLGFSRSRFYAPHLASLITFKGRDILLNTKSLAEKLNYKVVYGDTDSIMINTNSTDFEAVNKIGLQIKSAVNKTYRHVELDIDGVFQFLLLLKKKKYAAVTVSQKNGKFEYLREYKGLDIVRRDWSKIASNTGRVILDILLTDDGKEMDDRVGQIYTILEELKDDLLSGNIPLPMLEITKQLTRGINEYVDTGSLPHVQVAIRMNANKNRRFKRGDMISYIICEDGTDNGATKRAYHIDEIKSSDTLKIDTHYYLQQQVYQVLSRLVEPIDCIENSLIAMKLGLDASKCQPRQAAHEVNEGESIIKTAAQKFRQCEKFKFDCRACKGINIVAAPFKRDNANQIVSVFDKCMNASCNVAPYKYTPSINNQLLIVIHKMITKFHENWYICDNPLCNNNTQITPMMPDFEDDEDDDQLICLECDSGNLTRAVTSAELNNQLSYFKYMFDLQNHDLRKFKMIPEIKQTYQILAATVEKFISRSAYFYLYFSKVYETYAVQLDNDELRNLRNDVIPSKMPNNQIASRANVQVINWAKYLKKYH